jgi:hypothetical protein
MNNERIDDLEENKEETKEDDLEENKEETKEDDILLLFEEVDKYHLSDNEVVNIIVESLVKGFEYETSFIFQPFEWKEATQEEIIEESFEKVKKK